MKTEVWAHRGASGYAPENTLEAFELAVKQNADGIELDVQLSRDGELVVIHDETIERVSGIKGNVRDFTLEQLKALNVNRTHTEYHTSRIPALKEVYELIYPTGLCINVELKTGIWFYPGIEEKLIQLTQDMNMQDRVWYSSFNHASALKMKQLDASSRVGLLYSDGWMNVPEYAENAGADALHPMGYNLQYPGFLEQCRERNLKIHVWTINREEDIRTVAAAGADAIITNYPDRARKVLEEY
ncbi:MAG: glycerophosphodiester phosphodiesterase [Lachnospiraceae bacterium]|nr:glycerophosphodiester phosphodiesterase [Lachnospiraceae bacterium]